MNLSEKKTCDICNKELNEKVEYYFKGYTYMVTFICSECSKINHERLSEEGWILKKENKMIELKDLLSKWQPYQGLCSCCDHDGESDDSAAGYRTNELFEMIEKIVEILDARSS